jgi:tetratricopeptide (TPR) repeat protein
MAKGSGIEAAVSDEEQNLSRRERRAQAKKGGNVDGADENVKDRNQKLRADAAARRRKARMEERTAAAAEGLDAGERMDDALVRSSAATGRFLRDNMVWLQWVVILGLAGGMGVLIYNYRQQLKSEKVGDQVASVLDAQFGRLVDTEEIPQSDPRLVDPREVFPSEADRAAKALAGWQGLQSAKAPDLRLYSLLGAAGALYDAEKYSEAREAYLKVLDHPRIGLSPELKGRALEGIGMTWEAEGKYDEAIAAYEKVRAINVEEFEPLANFHIARVLYLKGDKTKALELLSKMNEEYSKEAGPQGPEDYIGAAVRDLLKTVDPSYVKKEREVASAAQMQQLMKQLEEMQKKRQGEGMPPLPPIPGLTPPEAPPSGDADAPLSEDASDSAPAPAPPVEPAPAPAPQKTPAPVPAPSPVGPAPQAPAPTAPAPTVPAPKAPAPKAPAVTPAPVPAPVAPAPVAPAPVKTPTAPSPPAPPAPESP